MLSIPESVLQPLPQDERADLESMLGEVFEVYEIDEWSQAWVQKHWPEGDGRHRYHSLGLETLEMELVEAEG